METKTKKQVAKVVTTKVKNIAPGANVNKEVKKDVL